MKSQKGFCWLRKRTEDMLAMVIWYGGVYKGCLVYMKGMNGLMDNVKEREEWSCQSRLYE